MSYSELIKNFERIRDYMREFFVYGFKSRDEYSSKSARSYDNERRRIESWLGDYMSFRQSENGKNVFLSLDIREMEQNPLFKAFKAKSFTDKDIILFFYIMDILNSDHDLSAADIHEKIAEYYLHPLMSELDFDLSTLRKKLKEFEAYGVLRSEKSGNKLLYSRCDQSGLEEMAAAALSPAIDFFTEEAPLGVIGSYISDSAVIRDYPVHAIPFSHKHHYILDVLDSEIMMELLTAIREHRAVEVHAVSRKGRSLVRNLVPLKIFVSTQQGRYYLVGYNTRVDGFDSVRTDNIHDIITGDIYPAYDKVLKQYIEFRKYLWGVSFNRYNRTIQIEMDVRVAKGEEHIIERLKREARCGWVLQISEDTWRYAADVYDTKEMLP